MVHFEPRRFNALPHIPVAIYIFAGIEANGVPHSIRNPANDLTGRGIGLGFQSVQNLLHEAVEAFATVFIASQLGTVGALLRGGWDSVTDRRLPVRDPSYPFRCLAAPFHAYVVFARCGGFLVPKARPPIRKMVFYVGEARDLVPVAVGGGGLLAGGA